MMLLENDLLEYCEPCKRVIRILWLSLNRTVAFVIDINLSVALPEQIEVEKLIHDLNSQTAKLLKDDPFLSIYVESELDHSYLIIRDKAWSIVSVLIKDTPRIFVASHRAKSIRKLVDEGILTRPTIYGYLRRFWQRGQTPNSLLPDYFKCGAKGSVRISKTGEKRGRPRKYGDETGINVSQEIRRVFNLGVSRTYVTKGKFSLRRAYDQMIKDFFCQKTIDPESGRINHHTNQEFEEVGLPTFGQFSYWYSRDHNRLEVKRKRLKPRIYDKDLRGLLSTSNIDCWGPGARYQIDATIADVYLVSRIDRNKIIGRPVLYFVIDVFSRMIVGIYVGLEGPSWVGAMMALANTVFDKQTYCEKFGIQISPEDWPACHLPAVLLGDRGEIEGRTIETLINNFNVSIENSAAYRADWKGVVEQRFNLIPAKYEPYVPGYIQVDFRARGGKDYRYDAVLDLDQFTQIIIECVLYYNNNHEIKNYDKDRQLAADGVLPVPIDLWEWGVENRSGKLRQYPEELVRFSLMPTAEATVTEYGIRLFGKYYTCEKAIDERWFDRARQEKKWKQTVSYDPRNLDQIYLHTPDTEIRFHVCTATERSRAYQLMSMWETMQHQEIEKDTSAKHQRSQQLAAANLSANIENIVFQAEKDEDTNFASHRQKDVKKIRENRAVEKKENRIEEVFKFNADKTELKKTDSKVNRAAELFDNYDEPDIFEILENLDGD